MCSSNWNEGLDYSIHPPFSKFLIFHIQLAFRVTLGARERGMEKDRGNESFCARGFSVGAEKAFERIQCRFIIKSLNKLEVEGHLLNWIKGICKTPAADIILNS